MITFEKLLHLASQAASDRSLIPNHLGTVDRRLTFHLKDRVQLLTSLLPHENEPTAAELIPGLRHDIGRIQVALRSYASEDHAVDEFDRSINKSREFANHEQPERGFELKHR